MKTTTLMIPRFFILSPDCVFCSWQKTHPVHLWRMVSLVSVLSCLCLSVLFPLTICTSGHIPPLKSHLIWFDVGWWFQSNVLPVSQRWECLWTAASQLPQWPIVDETIPSERRGYHVTDLVWSTSDEKGFPAAHQSHGGKCHTSSPAASPQRSSSS